jgi:hypothetical protein
LAAGAKVRATSPNHGALNGCTAPRAGEAGLSIDLKAFLLSPCFSLWAYKNAIKRGTVEVDGLLQYGLDGCVQTNDITLGQRVGGALGMEPSPKEGLVGIDVAQPGDKALIEEQWLEHATAVPDQGEKRFRGQFGGKGLRPQVAKHFFRIADQPDAAKLAHVVKVEASVVREVENHAQVFRPAKGIQEQAAAHTQMDQAGAPRLTVLPKLQYDVLGPASYVEDQKPAYLGSKALDVLLGTGKRSRPVYVCVQDGLPSEVGAQLTNDGLDFW